MRYNFNQWAVFHAGRSPYYVVHKLHLKEETDMATLGNRISEYRRAQGFTQERLAEKMGVTPQAVSKWENDISCPDISMLPQLAELFGVSLDQLIKGEETRTARIAPEGTRKEFNKLIMHLRVRSADGDKVNINLPMSLVKAGTQIGALSMINVGDDSVNKTIKQIDFDALFKLAEEGVMGNLLEVESANGDTVTISIE
jgi:transcriptional regulator with XRE-family HTH domain